MTQKVMVRYTGLQNNITMLLLLFLYFYGSMIQCAILAALEKVNCYHFDTDLPIMGVCEP